jgi:Cleaved Adhesin Domain/Secretion system C-terminal sorting domain
MKKITFLIAFIFGIIASGSAQFIENFDAGVTIPAGWSVINGGDVNTWQVSAPGTGTAHSGTNVARIYYSTAAHDDYLVTPQFTVTAGLADRLSLWARNRSTAFLEPFDILISTAGNTVADFTTTIAPAVSPPITWNKYTYDLSTYVGQSVYIAFHSTTTNEWQLYLDDIVIDTVPSGPPNCNAALTIPLNGSINAGITGAITWSAATGDPTGYNLMVGTTLGGGDILPMTDVMNVTTYALGALLPSTTYYVSILPYNTNGAATGCVVNSFTTNTPPANDDCANAITLISGTTFAENAIVGSTAGANTTAGLPIPTCVPTARDNDVWYTVTPTSTSMTVETSTTAGTLLTDTVMSVFSGTCGALIQIGCNDDITGGTNNFSKVALTGLTIGTPIYIGVWKYVNTFAPVIDGEFQISAYETNLASNSFDSTGFASYPNPVVDILNLSYSKNIDKVQVINIMGQEVISKAMNTTNAKVDMSALASGSYLVKVTSENQIKTIKVIKK